MTLSTEEWITHSKDKIQLYQSLSAVGYPEQLIIIFVGLENKTSLQSWEMRVAETINHSLTHSQG